ncbi:MAG: ABC transporter substrate-binding protein [Actinomycetota bacterium]
MKLSRHPRVLLSLLVVFALALTACGAGGEDTDDGAGQVDTGEQGGSFSIAICEPQFLLPGSSQETCGSQVLKALFTPLVDYDPDTAEPFNVMAESIESDDQKVWTVTIKDGWTFHNGEPVTAESFVDAWNWASYAPNKQLNSYFFANVEGYDDLNPAEGKPKTEEMSGLKVIDETTFEVTLSDEFSQFPLTVGYGAFYPLPQAFYDDPDAFNQAPIGNGPYQMDGKWKHDQFVKVKRYEDYAGTPGNADAIEFRIYADVNTEYTDLLAGEVDIIDRLPTEVLAQAPQELGDRYVEKESSYFGYLGFPLYQEPWDKLELRQAVSMAIDREAITNAIFQGAYSPAGSIISPVVPGFRDDVCGEICQFNPDKAKELWDANGGPDEITLWFNNDGGHEEWMEALGNQLRKNLDITYKFESLAFEEYLTKQDNHELTGPYRSAWVFDYPSPQNYLEPIFAGSGSSQEFGYEDVPGSKIVDDFIAQGNAADSLDEAIEFYHQAEDQILQDLPATPLWFGVTLRGYGERVDNVITDVFSFVRVAEVVVTDK